MEDGIYPDKLSLIIEGLEGAVDGMKALMGGMEELAQELSLMTDHYVELASCGDCGNWDPEKEERVISARSVIQEFKEAREIFNNEIWSVLDEAKEAKNVLDSF